MNNQKQITTVYVPTENRDNADATVHDHNANKGFLFAISMGLYLYTPEEHAIVQGHREALEKIEIICDRTLLNEEVHHIEVIVKKALSKAEDKGEGMKLDNFHKIVAETPQSIKDEVANNLRELDRTSSLDELERWVKYLEENQRFFTLIRSDDILAKIQSLKTITPNNGWISVEGIVHFLEWMNKTSQENPMQLETDNDDIAMMYLSTITP